MLLMIRIFVICLFSIKGVFGQVVQDIDKPSDKKLLSQITKESLISELGSLKSRNINELEEEISIFNRKVSYYILNRDKECKGEFSSVEINSNGTSEIVKRILSKEERRLCLLELIYFRKKYVSEIFKIRKKLLKFEHKKQLLNLDKIRVKSISSLDQLTSKLSK
jgi:hypothetical protein